MPVEYSDAVPHYDPDPINFTFSEPIGSIRGEQVAKLEPGDMLFFVASLAPCPELGYSDRSVRGIREVQKGRMAKYVIGFYRIETVVLVEKDDRGGRSFAKRLYGGKTLSRMITRRLSQNAHYRRLKDRFVCSVGIEDRKTLLLRRAVRLTQDGQPFRPSEIGMAAYGRKNFPRGFKWLRHDRVEILLSIVERANRVESAPLHVEKGPVMRRRE